MLTELRKKSQITIPKEIVQKLSLKEGDVLDVLEFDGVIRIVPVAVYPKQYIEELREEIHSIKYNIKSGKQPVFDNVDDLFEKLDKDTSK